MLADFINDVWLPATLVLPSLYALIFRLPAVLRGHAYEEYFLFSVVGGMFLMWIVGMVAAVVMQDMDTLFNMAIMFLVGMFIALTPSVIVIRICGGPLGEYREFMDIFRTYDLEYLVRNGVRDALRDHEAERSYFRSKRDRR